MEIMKESLKVVCGDKIERERATKGLKIRRIKITTNGESTYKYYIENESCFQIENESGVVKWYRIDNPQIIYNCSDKKWDLISRLDLISGTVGFIDVHVTGYFRYDENSVPMGNRNLSTNFTTWFINADVAVKMGYKQRFADDAYYKEKDYPARFFVEKVVTKYPFKLAYNLNQAEYVHDVNDHYNHSSKAKVDLPFAHMLNYKFGFELETFNGTLPWKKCLEYGVIPLKDGSLRHENGTEPYEYTTIPLVKEDLGNFKNLCNDLNKYCEFNHRCSLHIHMSGVKNVNEKFVIAFYKLCRELQRDIFFIFPKYKTVPDRYVPNFHKNYCMKLENLGFNLDNFYTDKGIINSEVLKQNYDRFHHFITDHVHDYTDDKCNFKTQRHPRGGLEKWNYNCRYHWVNLWPFIFNSSRTIEWRISTPTFHYQKIMNWLFICSAIMDYADNNIKEIITSKQGVTLKEVIYHFCRNEKDSKVADYMMNYINFRKSACLNDSTGFGLDFEFENDMKYDYKFD